MLRLNYCFNSFSWLLNKDTWHSLVKMLITIIDSVNGGKQYKIFLTLLRFCCNNIYCFHEKKIMIKMWLKFGLWHFYVTLLTALNLFTANFGRFLHVLFILKDGVLTLKGVLNYFIHYFRELHVQIPPRCL